jgi:hypothetical protein
VDPHANAYLAGSERSLPLLSCRHRVRCFREGIEEGISLRVDLDSAVTLEGFAEQAPVFEKRWAIAITELL